MWTRSGITLLFSVAGVLLGAAAGQNAGAQSCVGGICGTDVADGGSDVAALLQTNFVPPRPPCPKGYCGFTTFTVKLVNPVNYLNKTVDGIYMAYVTFADVENRGGKYTTNIETIEMLDELNRLAATLEKDPSVKVVVFQSANPDIFIAHYDIDELAKLQPKPASEFHANLYIQKVHQRISLLPQATIAKVEGFARGGGHEFVMACDMSFAAIGKAVFMQMEVGIGILPCGGGTQRIPRRVSKGRAMEIILGARDFDAKTAELYGTVNRAFAPDVIGKEVDDLANRIAQFPAGSIAAAKGAIHAAYDGTPVEEGLKIERFELGQALARTPAVKRFVGGSKLPEKEGQDSVAFQQNFSSFLLRIQSIQCPERNVGCR